MLESNQVGTQIIQENDILKVQIEKEIDPSGDYLIAKAIEIVQADKFEVEQDIIDSHNKI